MDFLKSGWRNVGIEWIEIGTYLIPSLASVRRGQLNVAVEILHRWMIFHERWVFQHLHLISSDYPIISYFPIMAKANLHDIARPGGHRLSWELLSEESILQQDLRFPTPVTFLDQEKRLENNICIYILYVYIIDICIYVYVYIYTYIYIYISVRMEIPIGSWAGKF